MNRNDFNLILTNVVGNALEWYDFALYGYFASIFSRLFFPTTDTFSAMMLTFGVFASGFIVRPFGGIIFGHIGDKYGRRFALLLSIVLITLPTTLIGLLPTYKTMGVFAPILLTVLRFFQGLAVSGELTGSGAFLVESARAEKRGFYGSFIMCSTYFGLLMGSAIAFLVSSFFSNDQVVLFAWRIPFLLSFFFGILALMLRLRCGESPMFLIAEKENLLVKVPLIDCTKKFLKPMSLIFFVSSLLAVLIYIIIGYLPTFFTVVVKINLKESMMISFFGLFVLTVLVPIFGFLTDKWDKKGIFYLGIFLSIGMAFPIFYLLEKGGVGECLLAEVLLSICLAPIASSIIAVLSEMLPTYVRYTGMSVGYNLSMAIFGGTTPLIVTFITKFFHLKTAPAVYLIFCGLISLFALSHVKLTNKQKD